MMIIDDQHFDFGFGDAETALKFAIININHVKLCGNERELCGYDVRTIHPVCFFC